MGNSQFSCCSKSIAKRTPAYLFSPSLVVLPCCLVGSICFLVLSCVVYSVKFGLDNKFILFGFCHIAIHPFSQPHEIQLPSRQVSIQPAMRNFTFVCSTDGRRKREDQPRRMSETGKRFSTLILINWKTGQFIMVYLYFCVWRVIVWWLAT